MSIVRASQHLGYLGDVTNQYSLLLRIHFTHDLLIAVAWPRACECACSRIIVVTFWARCLNAFPSFDTHEREMMISSTHREPCELNEAPTDDSYLLRSHLILGDNWDVLV